MRQREKTRERVQEIGEEERESGREGNIGGERMKNI
jgi:hypothetical protein